eukprot:1159588-Pelagomonas_calceolata.AAC.2
MNSESSAQVISSRGSGAHHICLSTAGAGNAFCGGFLASLVKSRKGRKASEGGSSSSSSISSNYVSGYQANDITLSELAEAAAWGAVSASFMIEEQGVPITPMQELAGRTRARFDAVRRSVEVCSAANGLEHASPPEPQQSRPQASPCSPQAVSSAVLRSHWMKIQGGLRSSSVNPRSSSTRQGTLLRPRRHMRGAATGPTRPVQSMIALR